MNDDELEALATANERARQAVLDDVRDAVAALDEARRARDVAIVRAAKHATQAAAADAAGLSLPRVRQICERARAASREAERPV